MLRLEGAAADGSDLELPANVTGDRRVLLAVTPAAGGPLAAGNHTLRLSLNGQFPSCARTGMVRALSCSPALYLSHRPALSVRVVAWLLQVVRVEGPTVAMAAPYVAVAEGGAVNVSLTLTGSSTLPVVANLTVSHRRLAPGEGAAGRADMSCIFV